jgi:hypothetical protein
MVGATGNYTQGWVYPNGTGKYGYDMKQAFKEYFGSKARFYLQQLPNSDSTVFLVAGTKEEAAAALAKYIECKIQDTLIPTDSPGGKELYIRSIKRNIANKNQQCPLIITRNREDYGATNARPVPHMPSIAWRFKLSSIRI